MKVIHRIVGTALAGAGLAVALTSVAAAQPFPTDAGSDPSEPRISCEGPAYEWSRGAWAYRIDEDASASRGESETPIPKGGDCEFGSVTDPRGWSEFRLVK